MFLDRIRIYGETGSIHEEYQGLGASALYNDEIVQPESGGSPSIPVSVSGLTLPSELTEWAEMFKFESYLSEFAAWVLSVSGMVSSYRLQMAAYQEELENTSPGDTLPVKPDVPNVNGLTLPLLDWGLMSAAAVMSPPLAAVMVLIRVASHAYLAYKRKQLEDYREGLVDREVNAIESIANSLAAGGLDMDIQTDSVGRVVRLHLRDGLAVNIAS